MDKKLRRQISIKCINQDAELAVGEAIHEQLRGNEDYINNNIILNLSTHRNEEDSENELHLYFFKECTKIPDIFLNFDDDTFASLSSVEAVYIESDTIDDLRKIIEFYPDKPSRRNGFDISYFTENKICININTNKIELPVPNIFIKGDN